MSRCKHKAWVKVDRVDTRFNHNLADHRRLIVERYTLDKCGMCGQERNHRKVYARTDNPERIIASAVHCDDGNEYVHQSVRTGFVIAGLRHANCFNALAACATLDGDKEITQGFLTDAGRFVDRSTALEIATVAGQVIEKHNPRHELSSEDIF